MLKELKISNLVLIEELSISFGPGMTVLTGETGAGKTIILQALNLLAGGKAGAGQVRTGATEAVVEGMFEIRPEKAGVLDAIRQRGFTVDDLLVIRRVIPANGNSRFYINGGFATAALAGEILENLLAVASQHEHQQLLRAGYHLDFIDALGGNEDLRRRYAELFDQWSAARATLAGLQASEQDKARRRDFLAFQVEEISAAAVTVGEDERLELEKKRARAVHELRALGSEALGLLGNVVTDGLAVARKNLSRMTESDEAVAGLADRVAGLGFELEDQVVELRRYLEAVVSDPARLEEIAARLDVLNQLKRKYGPSLEAVLLAGEQARLELDSLDNLDQQLAEARRQVAELEGRVLALAGELSAARQHVAQKVAARLEREFPALCLQGAGFVIDFSTGRDSGPAGLTRNGWDRPEFLFSANPGEPLKPLNKVASGGELSRLMLGLRCILATEDRVGTVLFDEVDSGVSGRAAGAIAAKLHELAGHHQVICISHLPQIASRATDHFLVEKRVNDQRTITLINKLGEEERVRALAGMLDGDAVSGKTLDYARELLGRHQAS